MLFSIGAFAQDDRAVQFKSRLNISESANIKAAWLNHVIEAQNKKVTVYRVQVYSGQGQYAKHKASDVKSKCVVLLPGIPSFIEWQSPYFKVSVGNFKDKSDATKIKEKLSDDFPGAFLVSTSVYPKIILSDE